MDKEAIIKELESKKKAISDTKMLEVINKKIEALKKGVKK